MLTIEEVRQRLQKACESAGSQTAWAKAHGMSGAYVSDTIHGRREPGEGILKALGLERVVKYRVRAHESR